MQQEVERPTQMSLIHPTAIIEPGAQIGENVHIGPFCVIGPNVVIGDDCTLHSRVTIVGHTTIGSDNEIHPNAVLGSSPQDLKYRGGPTQLIIGNGNQIREAVTIHTGTEAGTGITRIGNNNLLMVNAHIGHDATFGDRCLVGNNVMIAGHVNCLDGAALMGGVGVHHFVTIGEYCYIAGYARVMHDVPPYVKVDNTAAVRAVNHVGLKRNGFTEEEIDAIDAAARRLFFGRDKPFSRMLAELGEAPALNPRVRYLVEFLHRRNEGRHGRYLESLRTK
ncbi:MAG TPA: acyl-ACP--UDP-N-acetylglucosamine O-acyltransferase [Tepidisphaeraceae bacterium]